MAQLHTCGICGADNNWSAREGSTYSTVSAPKIHSIASQRSISIQLIYPSFVAVPAGKCLPNTFMYLMLQVTCNGCLDEGSGAKPTSMQFKIVGDQDSASIVSVSRPYRQQDLSQNRVGLICFRSPSSDPLIVMHSCEHCSLLRLCND